jgi:hypothetical protein
MVRTTGTILQWSIYTQEKKHQDNFTVLGHVVEVRCITEPPPTPASKLAKLDFSLHGQIAKT